MATCLSRGVVSLSIWRVSYWTPAGNVDELHGRRIPGEVREGKLVVNPESSVDVCSAQPLRRATRPTGFRPSLVKAAALGHDIKKLGVKLPPRALDVATLIGRGPL
jgi:hypothetical protein